MSLSKENIILHCDVSKKVDLLKIISQHAVKIGIADSLEDILASFLKREEEGSTGLDNQFAIPHAKSEHIKKATVLYLRNKKTIEDWETFDELGVKHIFALLVPKKEEGTTHLIMLSKLAVALMEDDFKKGIEELDDEEQLFALINAAMSKED